MNDTADVARLSKWDFNGRIPEDRLASVFADANFPRAARALSQNMLAAAECDKAVDGMVKDGGRYLAATWALYLHLSGGLTVPRLKDLCATSGVISPGRTRAILLYLRYLGYVTVMRPAGGGATIYAPTETLTTAFGKLIRGGLAAACLIEPSARVVLERLDEPDTLATMLRIHAEGLRYIAGAIDVDAAFLRIFMHRHAGAQILHAILLSAGDAAPFPPVDEVSISITTLARRFHVSRTHVRRLFEEAEREGFLARSGDGGVTLTESGRFSARYWFVLRLIGYVVCAAKTAKEIGAQRATKKPQAAMSL